MKKLIYSILILLTIGACTKNEPFSAEGDDNLALTSPAGCDSITIVPSELIDYYTDPFEINNVSISSSNLVFQVTYGGGCGVADFSLLVGNAFMESLPVQTQVILTLKDNDSCERAVTREVCFDLTELAELYTSSYQTSHGSILIRVSGQPSVLYEF